jgi:hypothetical protein
MKNGWRKVRIVKKSGKEIHMGKSMQRGHKGGGIYFSTFGRQSC